MCILFLKTHLGSPKSSQILGHVYHQLPDKLTWISILYTGMYWAQRESGLNQNILLVIFPTSHNYSGPATLVLSPFSCHLWYGMTSPDRISQHIISQWKFEHR